jgi:diacylglycerol kinase family enzyme
MKIHAVFNRDGGTFRTTDMDAYCGRASEIFGSHGHVFSCEIVAGSEVEHGLQKGARRDDLDALIAGGGDGTISTAAAVCWREGMPLGVVPAGTMNLFARSLRLPLDVVEALEVLARGRMKDADIASANGHAFVHQYSLGLHARMVRLRNKFRYRSRLGKMRASVHAAVEVMFDPPVFEVECVVDGRPEHARVSAMSVSNNHFGADPLLVADTLSGGELGSYLASPLTPGGVAKLAFDVLRGKLHDNAAISERGAKQIDLHFPKPSKRANSVIDGELVPLKRDVAIKLHAGELKLLAPQPGDERESGWTATGTPSRRNS